MALTMGGCYNGWLLKQVAVLMDCGHGGWPLHRTGGCYNQQLNKPDVWRCFALAAEAEFRRPMIDRSQRCVWGGCGGSSLCHFF